MQVSLQTKYYVQFIGHSLIYNPLRKQKFKEVTPMKTAVLNKKEFPLAPYPNAATRREVMHKILDSLLIVALAT